MKAIKWKPTIFYLSVLITGLNCSLTILPPDTVLQRFQNTSYTVGCRSDNPDPNGADDIIWRRIQPNNEREKIFVPRGKVHVTKSFFRGSNKTAVLLLVFENLDQRDSGHYECFHTSTKEAIIIEMDVAIPITFMDTPEYQEAKEFSNTTLRCEVAGKPDPEVHWSVEERPITQDSKFKELGDGLFVQNISRQDAGTYQCKAFQSSRALTDRKVKEIKLRVTYRPMFNKEFAVAYGYLNGTANVTCQVSAEPQAEFRWFRLHDRWEKRIFRLRDYPGSVVVNETNRNTLQIPVTNDHVFGSFLCEASNKEGRIESKITLKRSVAPRVPSAVEMGDVRDTSIELDIQSSDERPDGVTGYRVEFVEKWPGDPLKWTNPFIKDFKKHKNGDTVYVLDELAINTRYTIRIAARNLAGFSDFSPELSFQTKAMPSSSSPCKLSLSLATVVLFQCCRIMLKQ